MHVDLRDSGFDGMQDFEVGLARITRMYATLHADFRSAAVPCLTCAALNLIDAQIIRGAAQLLRRLAF